MSLTPVSRRVINREAKLVVRRSERLGERVPRYVLGQPVE
jgi:hypothetical protein